VAPTSLGSTNATSSADHTLTIDGATAGKSVVVVGGIGATITLHATSASAGWVQDDYAVANMGAGAWRLPGASNPGGTLTLRLTHNGARAFGGCAFEDYIDALLDSSGPSEASSPTTPSASLAAGDLVIAYFPMVSDSDQSAMDLGSYSSGFTELVDGGHSDGGGFEDAHCWVAYREDYTATAAITATASGTGGPYTISGGVLVYSLSAPPADDVAGELAGTLPKLIGSLAADQRDAAAISGTLPRLTSATAAAQTDRAAVGVALPRLSGAFSVLNLAPRSGALAGILPRLAGALAMTGGDVVQQQVGSWYGLRAVLEVARADAETRENVPPVACPLCFYPLQTGPDGVLFCLWDGWRPG
jgi:hypothetical protein